MSTTQERLKTLIIESLNLEDLTPADIKDDVPLFGSGLGLDSIDALELGIAIQKEFSLKVEGDKATVRRIFSNINTLSAYIDKHQADNNEE